MVVVVLPIAFFVFRFGGVVVHIVGVIVVHVVTISVVVFLYTFYFVLGIVIVLVTFVYCCWYVSWCRRCCCCW